FQAPEPLGNIYQPVVLGDDGSLYVTMTFREHRPAPIATLFALDAGSGKLKWTFSRDGFDAVNGPALGRDNTVFFTCNDDLCALDGATGKMRWHVFVEGDRALLSPVIDGGNTVYIGAQTGRVSAVDGATGAVRWTFKLPDSCFSSGMIGPDGTLYIGTARG